MQQSRETALAAALRQRGQRSTPQRLAIARVLTDLDRHVTAERVHAEVSARMPGVSLPTVYATLDLFEELGLVRRVRAGTGPALYDPRPEDHGHFACRRCGRVTDLDAHVEMAPALAAARSAGLSADRAEVVVTGLCENCAR